MSETKAGPPARRERVDNRGRRLLQLLALTGFALAQPLLDITGRSPDFFLFRRTTSLELAALVALIAFAPPLALWLVEVGVGLVSRTAERLLHLVFVCGLFTILAIEIGKQLDVSFVMGKRLALASFLGGVVAAVFVARFAAIRQALVYASPAPLVFVLVFALTTPSGALMRPAGASDAAAAASDTHPPLVMIVFDELPTRSLLDASGKVDARLFPNFAELAGTSTWYSKTSAVTGYTPFALPSILTGKYPRKRLAPSYVEFPNNLFTLLGSAYDVRASESITQLCPPTICSTAEVPAGRDTGLGAIVGDVLGVAKEVVSPYKAPPREGAEFAEEPELGGTPNPDERFKFAEGAKNQPERLTTFLSAIGREAEKPTLDFLHILLPHVPFRYTPSGNEYRNPPADFPLGRTKETDVYRINEEPGAAVVQQQRMLMQLVYTDTLLGQVLKRLRDTKVWDDAMVVVTADHGEGFVPDENVRHFDDSNMAELAYVPFFVKMPEQTAPKVEPRHVQHVDVLATIADLLDVPLSFKTDGVSALGKPRTTTERAWYDNPNEPRPFDGAKFEPRLASGFAHEIAKTALGPRGLFALGEHADLVGTPVADLTVGTPSPVKATQGSKLGFENAEPTKGKVQALLWGGLDGAPAAGTTWLVASVNGTVAGTILAARSRVKGTWHFTGMVDDAYYKDGRNDVRLWVVDGTTLHAIDWRR